MNISVREIKRDELHFIVDYFSNSDAHYLLAMGADKSKMISKKEWVQKLTTDFDKPINQKEFYYLLWLVDDKPVGHSNINKLEFGHSAYMHLHMWTDEKRKRGLGVEFVKQCIPVYFKKFQLEKLICEPYAENTAPNKVVKKAGFKFIKTHETVPGWISFKQFVHSYELTKKSFETANAL
jgi:RimJ/RimL family protein N-acetyltransferase